MIKIWISSFCPVASQNRIFYLLFLIPGLLFVFFQYLCCIRHLIFTLSIIILTTCSFIEYDPSHLELLSSVDVYCSQRVLAQLYSHATGLSLSIIFFFLGTIRKNIFFYLSLVFIHPVDILSILWRDLKQRKINIWHRFRRWSSILTSVPKIFWDTFPNENYFLSSHTILDRFWIFLLIFWKIKNI